MKKKSKKQVEQEYIQAAEAVALAAARVSGASRKTKETMRALGQEQIEAEKAL